MPLYQVSNDGTKVVTLYTEVEGKEQFVVALGDGDFDEDETVGLVFKNEYEAQILCLAVLVQIVNQWRREDDRIK